MRPSNGDKLWYPVGSVLLALAVFFNLRQFLYRMNIYWFMPKPHEFSYLEFDFPPAILRYDEHVYNSALTVEDSVHYDVNATKEWHSLFPEGSGGFVRLGPNYRLFGVSMFHQLHCLDKMRRAIVAPPPSEWEMWHAQHCLNYLRQMRLCAANVRLEPFKHLDHPESVADGDGLDHEMKVDGLGLQHSCRDWSRIREIAEENYKTWPADVYP